MKIKLSLLLVVVLTLFSCAKTGPGSLVVTSSQPALPLMEKILRLATLCWFGSSHAFDQYKMASELNSYSGRPRLLLVPGSNPNERPLLVIQAQGDPTKVSAYGPLMSNPLGKVVASDLQRWIGGDHTCGTIKRP